MRLNEGSFAIGGLEIEMLVEETEKVPSGLCFQADISEVLDITGGTKVEMVIQTSLRRET